MTHLYAAINNDTDTSNSSLESLALEMTSLQNEFNQGDSSTSVFTTDRSTVAASSRRRRSRTNSSCCSKKLVIWMLILIPIGLAALVLIILLAAGVISTATLGVGQPKVTTDAFVTCAINETRCTNGYECLENKYLCDGNEDCSDNSDERGCEGGCQMSPRLYFFCNNGDCIKKVWKCDREPDCTDGEDELHCERCNATTEFTCNNYECVPRQRRCDGRYDCSDRSDEYSCFQQKSDTIKYLHNGSQIDLCHSTDVTASAGRICALLGHRAEGARSSAIPRDDSSELAVDITLLNKTAQSNGTFLVKPEESCRDAVNVQCEACGESTKHIWAPYLVGGEGGFPISDWPWHVKLTIGTVGITHLCGGSIIANNWILTAAHCVSSVRDNPSEVKVVYGTNRFDEEGGISSLAKKVILHPQYKPTIYQEYFTTYSYDLALVEVDKINYGARAQPVCLPTQDDLISDDTNCYITGFGSIIANPFKFRYPEFLQEGKTRVFSKKHCQAQYQSAYGIDVPDDWMCAGYTTAGIDSCGGDSGGPLVCLMNRRWVLQGVVSWGSTCKQSLPSIYGRVAKITSWIDNHIS